MKLSAINENTLQTRICESKSATNIDYFLFSKIIAYSSWNAFSIGGLKKSVFLLKKNYLGNHALCKLSIENLCLIVCNCKIHPKHILLPIKKDTTESLQLLGSEIGGKHFYFGKNSLPPPPRPQVRDLCRLRNVIFIKSLKHFNDRHHVLRVFF